LEQAELHAQHPPGGHAMAVLRAAVGFLTFLAAFTSSGPAPGRGSFGLVVGAGAFGGFLGAVIAPGSAGW